MEETKIKYGSDFIYAGVDKSLFGLECRVGCFEPTDGVYLVNFRDIEPKLAEVHKRDLVPVSEVGRAKLTLGIDFDDTIVNTQWPTIKGLRNGAKEAINKLHEDGHYIIINTCRWENQQHEAEVFLYEQGIRYNAINRHNPSAMLLYGNDTRKIWADIYIDDKNLESVMNGLPEWSEIYQMVDLVATRKWLKTEYTEKCIPLTAQEFTSKIVEAFTGIPEQNWAAKISETQEAQLA